MKSTRKSATPARTAARKPTTPRAKQQAAARAFMAALPSGPSPLGSLLKNVGRPPPPPADTPPVRSPLLQMAEATINGPRQQEYGGKLQNFSQIAMILQGVLAHKLLPTAKLLPEDVAAIMIAVKLSRVAKTPDHFDSWLDIAGYAGCVDSLQRERISETELLGATEDTGNFIAKRYNSPE